ncbi:MULTISPECIES: hypothetical protein [unclassified Cryobacterium]|nr:MULTISPECIES: hypothetical protein [Cryobacterium]MEC5152587.1 hypothetical protein [Cryobacterium psychrotolerans]
MPNERGVVVLAHREDVKADFLSLDGDLHRRIDALVLVDEP